MAEAIQEERTPKATGGRPASGSGPDGITGLDEARASGVASEVARILGISVPVSVALAQRQMTIDSILAVAVGTILEFDVPSDAELTLYVGDQPIGKGQAVKVGENFGMRLTRVGTVRARIDALSPHDAGAPTGQI